MPKKKTKTKPISFASSTKETTTWASRIIRVCCYCGLLQHHRTYRVTPQRLEFRRTDTIQLASSHPATADVVACTLHMHDDNSLRATIRCPLSTTTHVLHSRKFFHQNFLISSRIASCILTSPSLHLLLRVWVSFGVQVVLTDHILVTGLPAHTHVAGAFSYFHLLVLWDFRYFLAFLVIRLYVASVRTAVG